MTGATTGATSGTITATTSVDRYLACMAAHDWDGLAATIADEGLVRDGPFCDVVEGKAAYVDFLRGIVTSLRGYELRVVRVSHASDRLSYVELSETFEVDGTPTTYPECVLLERDDDGLIRHVSVFIKQPGGEAPVEGGRASIR
jgi:SnoaL-like domain